jgi:hypothetical protein
MKRQREYMFVVVLMLIFPARIFSQQQIPRIGQNSPHTVAFFDPSQQMTRIFFDNFYVRKNYLIVRKALPCALTHDIKDHGSAVVSELVTQPNCYLSHLGFFCKHELQFEKNTSIPLRLRLGSLEYVDRMEGKK